MQDRLVAIGSAERAIFMLLYALQCTDRPVDPYLSGIRFSVKLQYRMNLSFVPVVLNILLASIASSDPIRCLPLPRCLFVHALIIPGSSNIVSVIRNGTIIDAPENSIPNEYHLRTSVGKRHLIYAHQGHGWFSRSNSRRVVVSEL